MTPSNPDDQSAGSPFGTADLRSGARRVYLERAYRTVVEMTDSNP
jgi:hypothetical protein